MLRIKGDKALGAYAVRETVFIFFQQDGIFDPLILFPNLLTSAAYWYYYLCIYQNAILSLWSIMWLLPRLKSWASMSPHRCFRLAAGHWSLNRLQPESGYETKFYESPNQSAFPENQDDTVVLFTSGPEARSFWRWFSSFFYGTQPALSALKSSELSLSFRIYITARFHPTVETVGFLAHRIIKNEKIIIWYALRALNPRPSGS